MKTFATFLSAFLFLTMAACDEGNEGDRCNPNLSHDECNDGLTCQQPLCAMSTTRTEPENYCCPADPSKSSNPYCNGLGCPPVSEDVSSMEDAAVDATATDAADATTD